MPVSGGLSEAIILIQSLLITNPLELLYWALNSVIKKWSLLKPFCMTYNQWKKQHAADSHFTVTNLRLEGVQVCL